MVRPHRTSSNHCIQVGSMPAGKVQVSSGWFDLTKPLCSSGKHAYREGSSEFGVEPLRSSAKHACWEGSSEFGVVRPHRISSNHYVQVRSMPAGKVQVSSGWFDLTKPLCSSGKHAYREGSSEFGVEPLRSSAKHACWEGSSEFGVVRPHRISSNHYVQVRSMPAGKVQVSSGRFDLTEPFRTSSNHCVKWEACLLGMVE